MADVHPKISRKEASKLLKVSIRTVDRYIKSKKLSTVHESGSIWLYKEEIRNFGRVDRVDRVDNVDRVDRVDKTVDRVDTPVSILSTLDHDVKIISNNNKSGRERAISTYQKLYDQLRDELKEKQERLEIANYRVGQLEAQVRNSLPMIELHRKEAEVKAKEQRLTSQLYSQNDLIKNISIKMKALNFNRRILLILFLILLALQPLWLLIINRFG